MGTDPEAVAVTLIGSVTNAAEHALYSDPSQPLTRFELPKDYTQAVFLPCGYYKGKDFKPATRPPGTQRTHWETW